MHQIQFFRGLSTPSHPIEVLSKGCAVTIGAFDGVHTGHQQLIERIKALAIDQGLSSVVVLFEPQPNEYFNPENAPVRLMRLREKVRALAGLGVDAVLCLRFDQHLRAMTAAEFVDQVLIKRLLIKHLVVGDDFRFGCDRSGDFQYLQAQGLQHGFSVVDSITHSSSGKRISSTRIRALLANAELGEASTLLGQAYSSYGRVIYGKQLGRKLGFPTMNIALGRLKVPLTGVFTVKVIHNARTYFGVANVGTRPTVDGVNKPILEVHVLDTSIDCYGDFVQIIYCSKLRDEKKFDSLAELQKNIAQDVEAARLFFKDQALAAVDN